MQDALELGNEELVEQAQPYLAHRTARAGGEVSGPEVYATAVQWRGADFLGRARARIRIWEVRDYRDRLKCPGWLAECVPGVAAGSEEERQCVFLDTAASHLTVKLEREVTVSEAQEEAQA